MKFAITILFSIALFFGCTPAPEQPAQPSAQPSAEECEMDKNCCDKVAGRYHLRSRTKRFFRRVS